ncbi:MAG: type I DNA topoisomerase [Alphaproteobacteria bacterium]|nr:type I DNA topoisomerase [Alphaproteobacteria bacterium]
MDVVVVESPAKAKTINKYLGDGYTVLASYGHVRGLPAKDGSVRPDADFEMIYETDPAARKHLDAIAKVLVGAKTLYLATDPDREGEAISWHVLSALREKRALGKVAVKRVVFHEITRGAVAEAMAHPRDLDMDLVNAQQARRALDYLVGFTLSPVLWRKLPGSRSAGRVQSVALRLVCEREGEIEAFRPQEYWTVEAEFQTPTGETLRTRLTHLAGNRLDKFALPSEADAAAAVAAIERGSFRVASVEPKQVRRHPFPPFTTSTLQQEASRKLGFSAKRTMQVAQRLYEGVSVGGEAVGLITYMRTDSVQLSNEAISGARAVIGRLYGARYVPDEPRAYRAKSRNAQEAHEAIRPTDLGRLPADVARHVGDDERRLYDLIWKRTVACQMASAILDQVTVDIASAEGETRLRAVGSVVAFDGFLKLYMEDRDDPADADEDGRILPRVAPGDSLTRRQVTPSQHFTEPPPRYSEASLVKKMEELGIGRPSTYASTLTVLQDREYVRLESRRFIPESRGRLVTAFLVSFFPRYVEYGFTADLEDQLDEVSNGTVDWKALLREFWAAFRGAVDQTGDLGVRDVLNALEGLLEPYVFPARADASDARRCATCGTGQLSLKLGRFGAFVGCSHYPECRFTRQLSAEPDAAQDELDANRVLGTDPVTAQPVSLRKGPYGLYLQLGEKGEDKKAPKRVALPKGLPPAEVDLARALALLALPREVGAHPETAKPITAGQGRFGPYLKHDGAFTSLPADDDVLSIGLNRAVILIAEKGKGRRRGSEPLKQLGAHPEDGAPVEIHKGRYGPYAKHGRVFATLPKEQVPESVTLEEAVALLAARAARGGKGKRPKGGAKKAAPKATKTARTKATGTKATRPKAAKPRAGRRTAAAD